MTNEETARVFVSYSRRDQPIVTPIVQIIRATGGSVFQDVDSIPPGKRWRLVIEESLDNAKVVLVFWCVHSEDSIPVRDEWQSAIRADKVLVPILLDDTPLDPSLSEFQWIDMRSLVLDHIPKSERDPGLMPTDLKWHRYLNIDYGNHVRRLDSDLLFSITRHLMVDIQAFI